MKRRNKIIINPGDRFGRLVVLRRNEEYGSRYNDSNSRGAYYDVRCDCGVEFTTRKTALAKGSTRSCGCIRLEMLKARGFTGGRKTVIHVTKDGETHSIPEWSKLLGVKVGTLYTRLYRYGNNGDLIIKENEKKLHKG